MNINIICVGKLKEKYLLSACEEYAKRLSRFCKLNIIEIADIAVPEKYSEAEKEAVLSKEAEKIISHIKKDDYVFSLCVEGKQQASEEFAELIKSKTLEGKSSFTFIIGSSCGLAERVKKISDFRLSFSKMTLPHQLMRVVLLEQIYRAFKITAGESYHK